MLCMIFNIHNILINDDIKEILNNYYIITDTKYIKKIQKPDLITLKYENLQMDTSQGSILLNYCV